MPLGRQNLRGLYGGYTGIMENGSYYIIIGYILVYII